MSKKYFEQYIGELDSAMNYGELLDRWHGFDFEKITYLERNSLSQLFYKKRDEMRGYSNKLSTDLDRAEYCHDD